MEEGGCPMTPWGVTVVLASNCPAGRSFGNSDEGSYDFCRAFLRRRRRHLDGRARQHGGRM